MVKPGPDPALVPLRHERSPDPFRIALVELKESTGLGWADFARKVSAQGVGEWSSAYLNGLAIGRRAAPGGEALLTLIDALARAGGVKPAYFREYREHTAAQRAAELARVIGLDEVLAVLDELERRG